MDGFEYELFLKCAREVASDKNDSRACYICRSYSAALGLIWYGSDQEYFSVNEKANIKRVICVNCRIWACMVREYGLECTCVSDRI